MSTMSPSIRAAVVLRANQRCEYCRLAQAGQEAAFHIDHVTPRAAGGPDAEDNLALACVSCSLHKAAKQTVIDPQSGEEIPLFNPRSQNWTTISNGAEKRSLAKARLVARRSQLCR